MVTKVPGAPGVAELNDDFRSGFDSGFTKNGNQKISSRDVPFQGRTAYRVVGATSGNGIKLAVVCVAVLSHNRVYAVGGYSKTSEADTDPEINAAIDSFRLLDPPDPPTPVDRRDWAERVSEKAGEVVGVILVIAVVIWIIRRSSSK
jgi:hypothetical protein